MASTIEKLIFGVVLAGGAYYFLTRQEQAEAAPDESEDGDGDGDGDGDESVEGPQETDVLPPGAVTVEMARDIALDHFGLPPGTYMDEVYHELTGPNLDYVQVVYEGPLWRDGVTYWVDITFPRTTLTSYDVTIAKSSGGLPVATPEDTFTTQVITVVGRVLVQHGGTAISREKPSNWSFPRPEFEPPEPPDVSPSRFFQVGDVNLDGKVNIVDAMLLSQYLAGSLVLTTHQAMLADVNQDGEISQEDVDLIAQYTVGMADIPDVWINSDGIVMHQQG